jgi:GT2 family glycosyltransferase
MKKKKLAIIIITYNNENQVIKCLESIEKNQLPKQTSRQLVVIDNNSQDQTTDLIKAKFPNCELVKNSHNVGFGKAVNQGIKLATNELAADFVLLVNPDATLDSSCIDRLLQNWNNKIGAKSPKIINPENNKIWFAGSKIDWLRMCTEHIEKSSSTDYLSGCVFLLSKETIKKTGLFDEKFFLYYEDADYSLRIKKTGLTLKIEPEAIAYHTESQSSTSEIKAYHLVKSGLLFFHKHYSKIYLPYFWLVFSLRLFYHKFFSKKKPVLNALADFQKRVY